MSGARPRAPCEGSEGRAPSLSLGEKATQQRDGQRGYRSAAAHGQVTDPTLPEREGVRIQGRVFTASLRPLPPVEVQDA
jgi:hypothetical protein